MSEQNMSISKSWNQTKLWKKFCKEKSPGPDGVQATLTICMPDIEKVLNKGGTSPADFTLHDGDHSFRVAERMVELIPSDTFENLSSYELALLLLSAYLHDIGMTPEESKVQPYYEFLLSGDQQTLNDSEIEIFQDWVDNFNDEVSIPLQEGTPTPKTLRKAQFLTAHFCRNRHVEWGKDWIVKNLKEHKLGGYNRWLDDLIVLCRSHHEGYDELVQDLFNPKPVGGNVVHLRYLAVVLRVADILEFDPERTPEVIFQHRDIHPESIPYWYKDHGVSLHHENGQLTIFAQL